MWEYADVYKKNQFAYSYMTLHEWYYKKRKGKTMQEFLEKYGYNNIAIYAFGTLGHIFYDELFKSRVKVKYIIDKNYKSFDGSFKGAPVIGIEELFAQGKVDAFVICHVYYYNALADNLIKQGIDEEKILSLNDIVFTI